MEQCMHFPHCTSVWEYHKCMRTSQVHENISMLTARQSKLLANPLHSPWGQLVRENAADLAWIYVCPKYLKVFSRGPQGACKLFSLLVQQLLRWKKISCRNWASSFLVWNPLQPSSYQHHTEKILRCPWEDCKFHPKCILLPLSCDTPSSSLGKMHAFIPFSKKNSFVTMH